MPQQVLTHTWAEVDQATADAIASGLGGDGLLFTLANPEILGGDTDGAITIGPSTTSILGGGATFYSEGHATKAGDVELTSGGAIVANYDLSGDIWDFPGEVSLSGGVSGEVSIDQDADLPSVSIDSEAATASVIDLATNVQGTTTGKVIDIIANALTTGSVASLLSNDPDANGRELVTIESQHAAAVAAIVLNLENAAGIALRVGAGTTHLSDNVGIGVAPTSSIALGVQGSGSENIMVLRDSGGVAAMFTGLASQTYDGTPNAADAVLKLLQDATSTRSITGAGSIVGGGADSADYEKKSPGVGVIAKGDIVGFNVDGLLTDKFSEAISFGVKATNPQFVGGDNWADGIDPRPVKPELIVRGKNETPDDFAERLVGNVEHPEYTGPKAPKRVKRFKLKQPVWAELEQSPKENLLDFGVRQAAFLDDFNARLLNYDTKKAEHDAAILARDAEQAIFEQAGVDFKAVVDLMEAQIDAEYQPLLDAWLEVFEIARETVDRVTYGGSVPVNAEEASVGDHIVPTAGPNDSIKGTPIADPTLSQYILSVGQVKSVDSATVIRVKCG